MIHQFWAVAVAVLLAVGAFLGSPLAVIADDSYTQSQSASQQAQVYPDQSTYDKAQDGDYSDKQTNQAKPQEKQSNQADASEKQYAQQEQSYQSKQ